MAARGSEKGGGGGGTSRSSTTGGASVAGGTPEEKGGDSGGSNTQNTVISRGSADSLPVFSYAAMAKKGITPSRSEVVIIPDSTKQPADGPAVLPAAPSSAPRHHPQPRASPRPAAPLGGFVAPAPLPATNAWRRDKASPAVPPVRSQTPPEARLSQSSPSPGPVHMAPAQQQGHTGPMRRADRIPRERPTKFRPQNAILTAPVPLLSLPLKERPPTLSPSAVEDALGDLSPTSNQRSKAELDSPPGSDQNKQGRQVPNTPFGSTATSPRRSTRPACADTVMPPPSTGLWIPPTVIPGQGAIGGGYVIPQQPSGYSYDGGFAQQVYQQPFGGGPYLVPGGAFVSPPNIGRPYPMKNPATPQQMAGVYPAGAPPQQRKSSTDINEANLLLVASQLNEARKSPGFAASPGGDPHSVHSGSIISPGNAQRKEMFSEKDSWADAVKRLEDENRVRDKLSLVINERYKILFKVNVGSYGSIYAAQNIHDKPQFVAVKFEPGKKAGEESHLDYEADVYKSLWSVQDPIPSGLPRMFFHGSEFGYQILVIDLLGPSLENLFGYCERRWSVETVVEVGRQMVERVRQLHSQGFIHRDLKPDNFLIGTEGSGEENTIFLVDFGLTRKFTVEKRGRTEHVAERKTRRNLVGTAKYASVRSHDGLHLSRRDDIESLGYIIVEFLQQELPWKKTDEERAARNRTKQQTYARIRNLKEKMRWEETCPEMAAWFEYTEQLTFEEQPDYDRLHSFLRAMLPRQELYGRFGDRRYQRGLPTPDPSSSGPRSPKRENSCSARSSPSSPVTAHDDPTTTGIPPASSDKPNDDEQKLTEEPLFQAPPTVQGGMEQGAKEPPVPPVPSTTPPPPLLAAEIPVIPEEEVDSTQEEEREEEAREGDEKAAGGDNKHEQQVQPRSSEPSTSSVAAVLSSSTAPIFTPAGTGSGPAGVYQQTAGQPMAGEQFSQQQPVFVPAQYYPMSPNYATAYSPAEIYYAPIDYGYYEDESAFMQPLVAPPGALIYPAQYMPNASIPYYGVGGCDYITAGGPRRGGSPRNPLRRSPEMRLSPGGRQKFRRGTRRRDYGEVAPIYEDGSGRFTWVQRRDSHIEETQAYYTLFKWARPYDAFVVHTGAQNAPSSAHYGNPFRAGAF